MVLLVPALADKNDLVATEPGRESISRAEIRLPVLNAEHFGFELGTKQADDVADLVAEIELFRLLRRVSPARGIGHGRLLSAADVVVQPTVR